MEKKGLWITVLVIVIVAAAIFVVRGTQRKQRVPDAVMQREFTKVCANCSHMATRTLEEWLKAEEDPVTGYKCPKCGEFQMRRATECPHCGATIPDPPKPKEGDPPVTTYKCPKCNKVLFSAAE